MNKWRRIRAFSAFELGLIAWVAVLLALARTCMPLVRFRAAGASPPERSASRGDCARAEALARMVGIASRHGPVEVTCLHRSLVLWWLLRRRGIPCAIHLGTRRAQGLFEAHAWIECAGAPIGENAACLDSYHAFERRLTPSIRMPSLRGKPKEPPFDVSAQGRFGP